MFTTSVGRQIEELRKRMDYVVLVCGQLTQGKVTSPESLGKISVQSNNFYYMRYILFYLDSLS